MITISSKRSCVRIISYLLFAFAVLGAMTGINIRKANGYRVELNAANQRSLIELSDYMGNIELDLNKSLYTGTPEKLSEISASLWREASCAKNSLSEIPLSDTQMSNTYKFLSQVGDYALYLSAKAENGEQITDGEYNQLLRLSELASSLSKQISTIAGHLNDGNIDFSKISGTLANIGDTPTLSLNISSVMSDTEQTLTYYPTLIYDGPFSDHMTRNMPKMTADAEEISLNKALEIAADFACVKPERLKSTGLSEGNMPCYNFTDGGSLNISVTKQGGFVAYTLNSRYAAESSVSIEEATQKALEFMNENSITDMTQSYYAVSDGIATINFAYKTQNTVCYPDLIKVSVALDNGDILSFDAGNYLMNHHQRELDAPKITVQEAQKSLNKNLTVQSSKLAVIPTESANEIFCFEFLCKGKNGEDILIYINADTGAEEDILLLLYSDNGVFTK